MKTPAPWERGKGAVVPLANDTAVIVLGGIRTDATSGFDTVEEVNQRSRGMYSRPTLKERPYPSRFGRGREEFAPGISCQA